MIYLATFSRKSKIPQLQRKPKLTLDKVIALIKKLTTGDFEESSVEIIGEKTWDSAKINHPSIKVHKLD